MVCVNWEPKAKNIMNIAKALNIGMDAIAFVDDNPFEREQVKKLLPDVSVYDQNQFPQFLTYLEFEPAGRLTEEAANRAELYKQQAQRKLAEDSFQGEYTEFLKSCEMKVSLMAAKEAEIQRIALETGGLRGVRFARLTKASSLEL